MPYRQALRFTDTGPVSQREVAEVCNGINDATRAAIEALETTLADHEARLVDLEREVYVSVNADGTSIAATTTPQIVDLQATEASSNVTVDLVANTITYDFDGIYQFVFSLDGVGDRNTTYAVDIRANSVVVGTIDIPLSGNVTTFSHADTAYIPVLAGDVVDFQVSTASGTGTLNFDTFTIGSHKFARGGAGVP